MNTEIYAVGFIIFFIIAIIFAANRWPDFFKHDNNTDPPIFPMA